MLGLGVYGAWVRAKGAGRAVFVGTLIPQQEEVRVATNVVLWLWIPGTLIKASH